MRRYELLRKHKLKFPMDGLKIIQEFCNMIKDNTVVTLDINDGNDIAITRRTTDIGNDGGIAIN